MIAGFSKTRERLVAITDKFLNIIIVDDTNLPVRHIIVNNTLNS